MLVGYVSDERYVALADVLLEFERDGQSVAVVRSPRAAPSTPTRPPAATGSRWSRPGFGSKSVDRGRRRRTHRRTSSACSPTACSATSGPSGSAPASKSEFRVHSVEPYKLSLWRYGLEKEFIRHARLVRRARPAGRRCRSRPTATTRRPASAGTRSATPTRTTPSSSTGPRALRPLLLPRRDRVRAASSPSPGSSPRPRPARPDRGAGLEHHLERLQQLRRPEQLHQRRPACRRTPTVNARQDLNRYTDPTLQRLGPPGRRLPAPLVRPPRADQPHPARRRGHRPDRGPRRLPPRPGRVAAAGLARARGLRLRLLRRDPAPRRHARPRRLPGADHQHPPRVLVARGCTSASRRGSSSAAGG